MENIDTADHASCNGNNQASSGLQVLLPMSAFDTKQPLSSDLIETTSTTTTMSLAPYVASSLKSKSNSNSNSNSDNYITAQLMKFVNNCHDSPAGFNETAIRSLVRRLRRGQERGTLVGLILDLIKR